MSNRVKNNIKPSALLHQYRNAILKIIAAHRVQNARVFGSVVHGTDTEHSDLDILVDPLPTTTLLDIGAIRYELKELLGISVDVLTPNALPEKFRQQVLKEAVVV